MYVDTAPSRQHGKVYYRHLLRDSYREDGKVKHRTIANISHCSAEEIEAIKFALKHKKDLTRLININDIGGDTGEANWSGVLAVQGGREGWPVQGTGA